VGRNVWVLAYSPGPGPATVLVLGDRAVPLAAIEIPSAAGARSFAVDSKAGVIYLSIPDQAVILRAVLPSTVLGFAR
jgi:hypothetical protein